MQVNMAETVPGAVRARKDRGIKKDMEAENGCNSEGLILATDKSKVMFDLLNYLDTPFREIKTVL